jgi:hypothetical protein
VPGKRVQFDDGTWAAVDLLARDRDATFQEVADEAFNDLLRKYHRFSDVRRALKESAKHPEATLNGRQQSHRRKPSSRRRPKTRAA